MSMSTPDPSKAFPTNLEAEIILGVTFFVSFWRLLLFLDFLGLPSICFCDKADPTFAVLRPRQVPGVG